MLTERVTFKPLSKASADVFFYQCLEWNLSCAKMLQFVPQWRVGVVIMGD